MLTPAKLNAKHYSLVHDYLNGIPTKQLADTYKIEEAEVSRILNTKEVKAFVAAQLQNYGYLSQKRRIDLLNKLVEEKLDFAASSDIPATNKDLLDIIKVLQEENKILNKQVDLPDIQVNVQAEYVNLVNSLLNEPT